MRSSSKDFKRKPASLLPEKTNSLNTSTPANLSNPSNKLSELQTKLKSDRDMMKNTGKRFRETLTGKTEAATLTKAAYKRPTKPSTSDLQKTSSSMSKKSICLSELSSEPRSVDLSSSQVFEKQKEKQEQHNKEVTQFLKTLGLEGYAGQLVEAGFDDIDTLLELDNETLNNVKMKAGQQKRLLQQLRKASEAKGCSVGIGTQPVRTSIISSISSRNRPKTSMSEVVTMGSQSTRTEPVEQREPRFMGGMGTQPSFLYSVGNKNWSLVSKEEIGMERKACCSCFKVTYEPLRLGNYYYCSQKCMQKDHKTSTDDRKCNTSFTSFRKKSPQKPPFSKEKQRGKEKKDESLTEDFLESLSNISLSNSFLREYK